MKKVRTILSLLIVLGFISTLVGGVGYVYGNPDGVTVNFEGASDAENYIASKTNLVVSGGQVKLSEVVWTCGNILTDSRDSKTYATVQIGSQCWMATNLDYDFDDSGDGLCSNNTWVNSTDTGWCGYYTGGPFTNEGLLYQWSAAMATNLCPAGWHIPTHNEWTDLERTACAAIGNSGCETTFPKDITTGGWRGQSTTTAEGEGSYLAGNQSLWTNGNLDHNGAGDNDFGDSGLALLPAGYRDVDGSYSTRSNDASLWSSTPGDGNAWERLLDYTQTDVYRSKNSKAYAWSVRCLKD